MIRRWLSNLIGKAQTDAGKWTESSVRIIDGTGVKGGQQRPFEPAAGVSAYTSWAYAATNLNANAVASQPLRLYMRQRSGRKLWHTRSVPRRRRDYLLGETGASPSRLVSQKLVDFGPDFEEVTESHPALELLQTVNPWWNGYDLLQLTAIYLELTGNAYWHPVLGEGNVPTELWPMPSQWMWVSPSAETFIDGYVYGQDVATQQRFEVDEVIHFRTSNPGHNGLFYGMGKPQAAWGVLELNEAHHEMDVSFTRNHARPDYLMVTKGGAGGPQLDRLEKTIEQKLKGTRRAGRVLSVDGDVTLMPMNFPPKDLAGRTEVVEEIAAAWHVPVSMLKANDPNLAGAKVGFAAWKQNAILPLLRLIEQKLNEQLLPLYGIEGDACLAFDNPVPEDEAAKLAESTSLVGAGIRTIDEDREMRGDEPVEGGSVPRINGQSLETLDAGPLGFGPGLGAPPPAPRPTPNVGPRDPDKPEAAPGGDSDNAPALGPINAESIVPGEKLNGAQITAAKDVLTEVTAGAMPELVAIELLISVGLEEERARRMVSAAASFEVAKPETTEAPPAIGPKAVRTGTYTVGERPRHGDPYHWIVEPTSHWSLILKGTDDPQDRLPNEGDDGTGGEVGGFRGRMAGVFDAQASALLLDIEQWREILADPKWIDQIAEAARPFIGRAIDVGGAAGVGRLPSGFGWDVTNPEVQIFVDQASVRLATAVNGSTVHSMSSIIGGGLERGETIPQLASRVRDWGGEDVAGNRAEMIARTESARAYVAGEEVAWRQSGVVTGKKWLLAPNPCEFCRAAAKIVNKAGAALGATLFPKGQALVGVDGGTLSLDYDDVAGPPLHPHCRCDLIPVLEGE